MRRNCLLSGAMVLWCLIFICSCQEQNSEPPNIDVISPLTEIVDLSKEMEVEIYLSDDDQLKSFEFWLKSSSGLEYFHEKITINNRDFTVSYSFDMSNITNRDFYLKIEAIDSDENKNVLQKSFTIDK